MWVGSNPKSKSKGHRAMVKQVVFFSDFYQSFLAIIVNTISSWELDAFDARVMLQYM